MDRRSILFALLGGVVAATTARNALRQAHRFLTMHRCPALLTKSTQNTPRMAVVMVWAFDAAADSIRAGGLAVVSDVVSGAAEQGTGTARYRRRIRRVRQC